MSGPFRAGLLSLGVVSVLDLLLPLVTDGEHPPMAVALVASALGLASLVLIALAWRGTRRAVMPLIILRTLSALGAVPAFFEPEVPAAAASTAGILVVVTSIGVALTLKGRREIAEGSLR